ncbi:MAG: phosphate ABC transporter permease PstA [Actinobacteria bacterium]|nr:MAG: phosphate ABC transporter permease PstA [Actinomycetota bacterium]
MAAVEQALTIDLRAGARARRRRLVNRIAEAIAILAAAVAVAMLVWVVWSVAERGASLISWSFLTGDLPIPFSPEVGGIGPLIVGSAIVVGIATAIALPVGVLIALFLEEFASNWLRVPIQLAIDLMTGLPSIIIAIFVFSALVYGHAENGVAGSLGLAIVMIPLITRATQEVLRLVPSDQREGALALGASRWRTVVGVILPASLGGILTGTVLAVARAVGETAPLLFATGIFGRTLQLNPTKAMPNMPVQIFIWSESPDPLDHRRAWATALVLMTLVLVMSLVARIALNWSRRNTTR